LPSPPAIVYLLHKGRTPVVLAASIALWGLQQSSLLGFSHIWSVADSSFPLFAWQLLMVLGLITGFHYRAISTWLVDRRRADLCAIGAIGLYLGLMWLYRYQGSHLLPAGPGDMAIDGGLFDKTNLAIGRVLAFLCLAVVAYMVVHFAWTPLCRRLGWFLIPLGQNSLYVYITHLFVLVALCNVAPYLLYMVPVSWGPLDTVSLASQLTSLAMAWLMVKTRFLFWLIPR